MSTSRGNTTRNRPQKHQNRTAFKNDLHDTSNKTKFLNTMDVSGVCQRCKDIIEWKIKYKKYKTLSAPRKCVGCDQKTVKHAYHVLCRKCASDKKVCAKCFKSNEVVPDSPAENMSKDFDISLLLKSLPERKRRTIQRFINKLEASSDQNNSTEMMTQIEELISKMKNSSNDIDSDDEDFDLSSNEDEP